MLQFFDTLTDDSGNSLLGATVKATAFPGGGAAAIYQTNGTAAPIANSTVVADITGQVSFYAPDGVYILTYSYKGAVYKTRSPVQLFDPTGFLEIGDGGTLNTYAITDQRLSASLYVGLKVELVAATTNTGAATFNLNSTGAVAIVTSAGAALTAGIMVTGGIYRLEYDGTHWQLVSVQPITSGSVGALIFPQSAAEATAGVTPTNIQYTWGDLRRYGATGGPPGAIPATDDSAAFLSACKAGLVIIPPEFAFKIVTGAGSVASPIATQVIIQGYGDNSQLYCDTTVNGSFVTQNYLLVCSGAGCLVRDCFIANITAPLKWQRRIETTVNTTATLLGTQTFTGSVAGATTGTLTAGITNGVYSFFFSDGEIRTVTITGTTTANWSGALSSVLGSITTATVATIIVTTVTGIAIGQEASGYGLAAGSVVTGVSGNFVTLSDPVPGGLTTPTTETYTFFGITFNTGGALLATLAFTNAVGFVSPSNNDTEWASLTALQQQQSWVGPVIYLTGDNSVVQNVKGQNFQTLQSGNNARSLNNRFQGGWNWGAISFLNQQIVPVEYVCFASGNTCQDHAYAAVLGMGYDGVSFIGNSARGCCETNYKCYPWVVGAGNTPGGAACKRIISIGNRAVAGFQGNFDYNSSFFPTTTSALSACIALGDYGSWSPFGGFGYQGDGWRIDIIGEMNGGPAMLANQISNSKVSVLFRENGYANLNTGVPNTVGIIGPNNDVTGRIYEKTARSRLGFKLAFFGGSSQATSSHMHDLDMRDNVTSDAATLQAALFSTRFNIRGNGPIVDMPPTGVQQVTPGFAASVPIDLSQGNYFFINCTSNIGFTIATPTNIPQGRVQFTIIISNSSGAGLGAITPGTGYKLTGAAFPSPSSGNQYALVFTSNAGGGFYETSRTGLVPN